MADKTELIRSFPLMFLNSLPARCALSLYCFYIFSLGSTALGQECLNGSIINPGQTYIYLTLEFQNTFLPTTEQSLQTCLGEPVLGNGTHSTGQPPNVTAIFSCQESFDTYYNGTSLRIANATGSALNVSENSCRHARHVCNADLCATGKAPESCDNDTILDECTLKKLGLFRTEAELEAELALVSASLAKYTDLIGRTVRGVLIKEAKVPVCLERYTNWLCRTRLPLLLWDGAGALTRLPPCLEVCWDVMVQCPFYLPAQSQLTYQEGNPFLEEQYAGTPVFSCPSVPWVKEYTMQSRYRVCHGDPWDVSDYLWKGCL